MKSKTNTISLISIISKTYKLHNKKKTQCNKLIKLDILILHYRIE